MPLPVPPARLKQIVTSEGSPALLDVIHELAQRGVHGTLAGVVGVRVDPLGDGAREMLASLGHLVLFRDVGLEVRVPVVAGVFELQELPRAVHPLEELVLRRNRECDGLEHEAVGGDAPRLQALDEGRGVVLCQPHVLVADVHHQGGEGRARIGEMVLDLPSAQERLHVGSSGPPDPDDVHAVRSLSFR